MSEERSFVPLEFILKSTETKQEISGAHIVIFGTETEAKDAEMTWEPIRIM